MASAERIPQSTAIRVPLQIVLSSDHATAATGKTVAVTISKNGAAYANPSAGATNASEIGSGSYYVDLSVTDTGTLGPLKVKGTATSCDQYVGDFDVVLPTLVATATVANPEGAVGTTPQGTGFLVPSDIGNRALQHCGADMMDTSLGFTENSKNAQQVSFVYPKVRRAELRRNVWRFAIRRTAIRPIDSNTIFLAPALWVETTTYFIGSIAADGNGGYWISRIPNNLGNEPTTSTTWEQYFGPLSVSLYDSSQTYFSGELVYTDAGDGTYNTYLSLFTGNVVHPALPNQWSVSTVYYKNQVVQQFPAWSTNTTYTQGQGVLYTDGYVYVSLVNSNSGHTPSSSSAYWALMPTLTLTTQAVPVSGSNIASIVSTSPINEWAQATTYSAGSFVLFNGSVYLAIASGTGQFPNALSSAYWIIVSNGSLYMSLVDLNLGNDPVSSSSNNDDYTKVLLHFDGTDASTVITDSNAGGSAHTWTAQWSATLSTTAFKLGTSSLLLNGSTDYVDTPDSSDFHLGTSDFTIECWFKIVGNDGSNMKICHQLDAASTAANETFYINRGTSGVFQASFRTSTLAAFFLTGTTVFDSATNTGWHHVAVVRFGNVFTLYLDGTAEATSTHANTINTSSNKLAVGRSGENSSAYWNGYIDEFRISVGVARYTANFNPSVDFWTSAFTQGGGNSLWMQVGGASFPTGVALTGLNFTYPIGSGPSSQSSTRNVYRLPAGYLATAPQDPKAGSVSFLGAPTGLAYTDWLYEGDFIITREVSPIVLRFVADMNDVSRMDDMFCEGLAARIALEVCEPLTQSTSKLTIIAKEYDKFMSEARLRNAIEVGASEPAVDDWIACRV